MNNDNIMSALNYIDRLESLEFFKQQARFSKMQFKRDVALAIAIGAVTYVVLAKLQNILRDKRQSQK